MSCVAYAISVKNQMKYITEKTNRGIRHSLPTKMIKFEVERWKLIFSIIQGAIKSLILYFTFVVQSLLKLLLFYKSRLIITLVFKLQEFIRFCKLNVAS